MLTRGIYCYNEGCKHGIKNFIQAVELGQN